MNNDIVKKLCVLVSAVHVLASANGSVLESSREIPVVVDVDVVVVGGSSGGVAAAAAAAETGASVLILSDRSYFGTDLCGTYRLWLEPGETPETPLEKRLFPAAPALMNKDVAFKYTADQVSVRPHRDSGDMLADGKYSSAVHESVQYNGNICLTLDLQNLESVESVHLLAYQRPEEFEVEAVAVSASVDGENWSVEQALVNDRIDQGEFETTPIDLSVPVGKQARWLRVHVKKSAMAERVLLGEVVVQTTKESADSIPSASVIFTTPMNIKHSLDEVLLDNQVQVLLESYPTDLLCAEDGKPAGLVIANRSGRQAVRAKVIIDATQQASFARMAKLPFSDFSAGNQLFKRVVVGGTPQVDAGTGTRVFPETVDGLSVVEYELSLPMADETVSAFALAEQEARDLTWQDGQKDASSFLYYVPSTHLTARKHVSGEWPGADDISLDAFRAEGVDSIFVLSGCADIERSAAGKLLRPLEFLRTGRRVGQAAAQIARSLEVIGPIAVAGEDALGAVDVGEINEYTSKAHLCGEQAFVSSPARALPVFGKYDVVVAGGGTGGAPAAIAAARNGAKTLVAEYLHGLGGTGTLGMIGKYWYGDIRGFSEEITAAVGDSWDTQQKMEWYRRELRGMGGDIWFGSMVCGVVVLENRVKGVVVATPWGRGVVFCNTVIDSTGNADVAIMAGAAYRFAGDGMFALQGAGLSRRPLGKGYVNSDWTYVDDSDVLDRSRAHLVGRSKYKNAYDISPLIATRERKSIVGDYTLSPLDIVSGVSFDDTIALARSNLDSHGYTIHPLFWFWFPPRNYPLAAEVPYRCLLPAGLDGVLVTGIGSSFHRDAAPVVRMQADVQNQGYAAGLAGALAAKNGVSVRQINVRDLQARLVEVGNLPAPILQQQNTPLPTGDEIAQALTSLHSEQDFAIVLRGEDLSLQPLKTVYQDTADSKKKALCARLLAALDDVSGAETLLAEVSDRSWDEGWPFTAFGNHGSGLSELDSIIIALGGIRYSDAALSICGKLQELQPDSAFSHFRSCAVALGQIGNLSAARVLSDVLSVPGMRGYAFASIEDALRRTPAGQYDISTREGSLRELLLAEALFRCGDHEGLGESILREYVQDIRSVYRRYASAVLAGISSDGRAVVSTH